MIVDNVECQLSSGSLVIGLFGTFILSHTHTHTGTLFLEVSGSGSGHTDLSITLLVLKWNSTAVVIG